MGILDTPSVSPTQATLQNLKQEIISRSEASRKNNSRIRGVMANPPIVTISATAPIAPYSALSITSLSSWDGKAKFTGGWLAYNSGFVHAPCMTKTIGAATGGTSANAYVSSFRMDFWTDAPVYTFRVNYANDYTPFRILIDGQYVSLTGHVVPAAGTIYYVTVDFTSAGGRLSRRTQLEFSGGPRTANGSNCVPQVGTMYLTDADSIWAPSRMELGPLIGFFGDSYTYGPTFGQTATATALMDSWARQLCDLLGWDQAWCSGLAGTGLLARAGGGFPNLLDRITDITSYLFDGLVIPMGTNDALYNGAVVGSITISPVTVQQRVVDIVSAIRVQNTNVPIVFIGPFRPTSKLAEVAAVDVAINAAVNSLNDRKIKYISSAGIQTGTSLLNGNNVNYLATDATHPKDSLSHLYLARRLAPQVLDAFLSMV